MSDEISKIKERLIKGNLKYVGSPFAQLDTNPELRGYLEENGQHPYAVVLSCSDSRVNVEAVFSCGLGELFVIRSAGNVCYEGELSSIAYAVDHLHVPFVLVLGHTHCGAVASAIKGEKDERLSPILNYIHKGINGIDDARLAEIANVKQTVEVVKRSVGATVEGAIYDIASGTVSFLGLDK